MVKEADVIMKKSMETNVIGYCLQYKADKVKNMFMAVKRVSLMVHDCNIMINELCKIKIVDEIVNVFEEMYSKNLILYAIITYNNIIDDLCKWEKICYAWKLVGKMHNGGQQTIVIVYNSLLHTLCKIKDQGIQPDLYT